MSIDTRFFRATVAAMFYFLSIVQGVSTLYPIYPMMRTAHCPKYQNLLLPTMSIDRQRGLSIVVDNGHWQERLRGHCVAAMIYLLYVQGVADQASPTQSTNHNTTDNATLNPHDAHCLVVETYNVEAPPHAILVPCTYCCSSRYIMHSFHTGVITIENKDDYNSIQKNNCYLRGTWFHQYRRKKLEVRNGKLRIFGTRWL